MTTARTERERTTGREPLTRERVLRGAIALADEAGLNGLTMRGLANRLGVEAMSLYHHVRSKDAIVSGAIELVFTDIGQRAAALPQRADAQWQETLRERILAARAVLLQHPWMPRALELHGVMTPALATWVDGNVATMRRGGLSFDLIHHAMHTLGSRQFGFTQELILDDDGDAVVDPAAAAATAALMPNVTAMMLDIAHDDPGTTLGWCDDQTEFEFALDVVLGGLARLA